MQEEKMPRSWLREDVEGTSEEREKMNKEAPEEERTQEKRQVERGEEKTEINIRLPVMFSRNLVPWASRKVSDVRVGIFAVVLVVSRCVCLQGRLVWLL